ncbi:retrovirus-related pol polyprotein from transposon TNT 1-94 [Tanacetum coccineum]
MDGSIPWDQKCKSSKELFKIKGSVDTIFDGLEPCNQTMAKRTYFGHIDPFIQNTIEGKFCPQIQRINADLEKFHLCLKEKMVANLRYFNSLKHEVDSLKSQLETQKTQFLNEIDRLSREYYYVDHMNDILGVYTTLDEFNDLQCDRVDQLVKCELFEKELSKSKTMSKSFESLQKYVINLELALQQYLKAQLQDKGIAISELKKLIENMKEKYVETKFEKSSVIRQPNAFKSQRQSVLGMYKVHTKPNQTRTQQLPQDIRKTNKRVPFSTGVISTTIVSRPQLKSNQLEDRVLHNNSEGKKHQVEDHRRNFKFSNNKMSVTACNDSLNAKTLNVNFICVTCGKCVLNDNHDMCVLHYINGVNSRTKMPMVVPIDTREPKRTVNQPVATSLKRTVATESTVNKPRSIIRKLYEQVSKTCSWWYPKFTPSGYKWKPKTSTMNVKPNVSMPLGVNSRTTTIPKPTTLRESTISNTLPSFNSFAARRDNFIHHRLWVLKAHDGKSQASKVYYVEGLNHNLFSVGQFCDADLEVAFRKSTCYIRDLKGNDLLTGSRGTDLYSITLQDTSTPNLICLMANATSSQAWLWHRHLSYLNFNSINLYTWTHFLRSKDETPEVLIDFLRLVQRGLHAQVRTVRTDRGTEFLNKSLHAYFAKEGIEHQTSTARTPEQNGIVERRNRALVEVARTMLSAAKVSLFFCAEAIATACFTQNRSLVIPRHEKSPYHIINGRKPSDKFFYIFVSLCYIVKNGENLDKMKEKGDACIFVGYST